MTCLNLKASRLNLDSQIKIKTPCTLHLTDQSKIYHYENFLFNSFNFILFLYYSFVFYYNLVSETQLLSFMFFVLYIISYFLPEVLIYISSYKI